MATQDIYYNDLAEAARRYPVIAGTIRKAQKLGVDIARHCASYGKNGKVAVHWLYVREGKKLVPWRHEILKGYLSRMKDLQKRNGNGNKTDQTSNAGAGTD